MGGLFGGSQAASTEDTRIGAIRIQTSAYGGVLPLVYGTTRISGNLIDYNDFVATSHTESTGGGKGGGGGSTNTTYTYSATVLLSLCEGVVNRIPTVWQDKVKTLGGVETPQSVNVTNEHYTIPSTLKVTAAHVASFKNASVLDSPVNPASGISNPYLYSNNYNNGMLYSQVAAGTHLISGRYSVGSDGVFSFSADDTGKTVYLNYSYTDVPHYKTASDMVDLTLFGGAVGQPTWSYMTAAHPDKAIPYSGMAYLAGSNFTLDTSAGVPNFSFEVQTSFALSATVVQDAQPGAVVPDFLTNPVTGAQFPTASLGDLTNYTLYVQAAGLFFSPALIQQEEAQAILTRWLQATNSDVVWSEGVLKFIPYGDETLTGNGCTYTPNLTPLYDLSDDDFLSDGEAPVTVKRSTSADAFNRVQVEYLDRANEYNTAIAEATDLANIDQYGLRPMSTVSLHEICDADIARHVAQLILQRALYIRNTYEFKLGWRHCLLEPMDLVTLSDPTMGLNKLTVRVTEIDEDDSGTLSIICEDWPFGIAGATKYPHQYADSFGLNMNDPAGDCVAPVIFETSSKIFGGRQQMMIATAGQAALWGGADVWLSLDGTTYKQIGKVDGPSRYGVTTSALPVGSSPDTTHTLGIDLSMSGGSVLSGTQADAESFVMPCWVGGELLSYRDATLTASGKYTLAYLVRGGYGTPFLEHPVGAPFVRVDDSIFGWEYPDELIGKQVSIKLTAFNTFGGGGQTLDEVAATNYTLLGKDKAGQGNSGNNNGSTPTVTTSPDVTIGYDAVGDVILSFKKITDPSIKLWEVRAGDSGFDTGVVLAQTFYTSFFTIPLLSVIGQKLWIKAMYTSGGYSAFTYTAAFAGASLPAITTITSKIIEPAIEFSWPAVAGADHYITYFEEGGVTTVRTITASTLLVPIPKYSSSLRVYAVNTEGETSKPYDQAVGIVGTYQLNEIVNIPLIMTTGQYVNMAFTNANQIEKVSLLGPSSFTTPIVSPNNAALYTFGYNLASTAGPVLNATPGSWFRQDFWMETDGFYESVPVNLGSILSGRLKLNLSKTVTAYGTGAGSAFSQVLGEYMADSTGIDLTDNKAFLSAQFYVCDTMAGPWVQANDGDWVTTCRYVKIVVKAEHVSPLTDCLVTAGYLTLDVPDITETGTKTAVTSAGATVTLTKTYNAVSLVLLTPKGNVSAWPGTPVVSGGTATFSITTNSATPTDIGYFAKGY
jgi:hypothetical protein